MKLLFILLFLPFFSIAQKTELNGVVTYFFNDYQGNKPDIGAKVYLIDSSSNPSFDFQAIYDFKYGSFYRYLYSRYLEIEKVNENIIKEYGKKKLYKQIVDDSKLKAEEARSKAKGHYSEMEKYGVENKEKFDSLDKKCTLMIYKMEQNNPIIKTVNGIGSYNFNISPGVYYVLIISKNRVAINMTESTGRVYCEKLRIKENESKDISYNFELY